MKKFLKAVILTAMVLALLTISAFASDYDHCADALHDLGLFSGTDTGYELDRAPNRAEASVMLVRLLGQEDAAKALTYSAPFTDVPEWAQPYVQYLYDNGLAAGTTDTTFGSGELCTAQQYATFLLRALGYSDKDSLDFTFANALEFGEQLGVVDVFNCDPDNFLRDDVVAMSYTALATAPKSGEADLLTKLVNTGAVKDAKGYDRLFKDFRDYAKIAVASNQNTSMSMIADVKANVQSAGINLMDMTMKMNCAVKMDLNNLQNSKMSMVLDMDMSVSDDLVNAGFADPTEANEKASTAMYLTDGYVYVNSDGQKVKYAYSADDANELDKMMSSFQSMESQDLPICLIRKISSTTSGNTTTYHATLAESAYNTLFAELLGLLSAEDTTGELANTSITLGDISVEATVKNGAVVRSKANMEMSVTAEGETMDMSMTMDMHDMKTGAAVNVVLPGDLDTYLDVTGLYEA